MASRFQNSQTFLNKTDKWLLLFAVFLFVWKMPIVAHYINTYIAMAICVVAFIYCFNIKGSWLHSRERNLLISLALVCLLQFFIDYKNGGTLILSGWSFFNKILPTILVLCICGQGNKKLLWSVMLVILTTSLITAITTFIGNVMFPQASRIMTAFAGKEEDMATVQMFMSMNIGSLVFIYTLTLLHPLVIGLYKMKRIPLYLAVVMSIVIGGCIFKSDYTTASLAFIVSCVGYFFSGNAAKAKKTIIFLGVVGILTVSYAPALLRGVASIEIFSGSEEKLLDLAAYLEGNESQISDGDFESRQDFYQRSIDGFLSSPLYGRALTGSRQGGGHSFFLDFLSDWGLLGLLIVLVPFYRRLFQYYKMFRNSPFYIYAWFTLVLALVLSFANPNMWLMNIVVYVPLFLSYASLDDNIA